MNFRLLCCIALGVFTAHIGVIMLWSHLRPHPAPPPRPKDNFAAQSATYTDENTGEKMIYQEFTVSTRFAPSGAATPPPVRPKIDAPLEPVRQ